MEIELFIIKYAFRSRNFQLSIIPKICRIFLFQKSEIIAFLLFVNCKVCIQVSFHYIIFCFLIISALIFICIFMFNKYVTYKNTANYNGLNTRVQKCSNPSLSIYDILLSCNNNAKNVNNLNLNNLSILWHTNVFKIKW